MEETYLPNYSESESKIFTQCTSRFYLRPVKILSPETSSILRYRECTKTTRFGILGSFRPVVKLGFDFPVVLLNQKLRPCSLNFDFDEERNPMLGSLKNSSFVKSPNFPQQKLKMPGIKFFFYRKLRPLMES